MKCFFFQTSRPNGKLFLFCNCYLFNPVLHFRFPPLILRTESSFIRRRPTTRTTREGTCRAPSSIAVSKSRCSSLSWQSSQVIVPALPTPILSRDGIRVSRGGLQWLPDPQPQDGEERPGRAQLDRLISQLEDKTKRETVVLAQAGPRLEESVGPDVRKSN